MSTPAIFFFGTRSHPGLDLLHRELVARNRRRVVFVEQETFPRDLGLSLGVGGCDIPGFLFPSGDEPLALADVVSACLDGFFISPDSLGDYEARDRQYVMTESWAVLIALFAHLSGHALVANHVTCRDHVSSRLGELSFLESRGLPVPRVLATSDPDAARAFHEALEGRVICKPVSSRVHPFRSMTAADLDNLATLALSPIHFEEAPHGTVHQCVVVGRDTFLLPRGEAPPPDLLDACRQACHELDLVLGEVSLRRDNGRWIASGLHGFPSPQTLSDSEVLDAACGLLETGRAALEAGGR